MGKKLLGSAVWAANGSDSIKLSGLPDFEPGGISYLDALWIDVNVTDLDNAGGTVTSIDLYNAIAASLTITDGTEPWGPVNLTGELIAESRYLARRTLIPYQGNSAGDSDVGAGSNNTRRFAIVYDFRAYGGDDGDATPLCKALKQGEVQITFGALPTNATNLVATLTFYAMTHGEPTVRAVPRVLTSRMVLPALTFDVLQSGIFLQAFLRNAADFVAADITRLYAEVGGIPIVGNADPFGFNGAEAFGVATSLAANFVQNSFCEPIGGAEPRALEVFAIGPKENWARRPMGSGLHFELTGGETAANMTLVTTYARHMDAGAAARQLIAAGAGDDVAKKIEDGAADVVKPKTRNGRPLKDPRLMGFLSVELTDEAALRRIGLKY